MKAICTFSLFREKIPLGEELGPAAEEQNSGVIILVTCVGMRSFTTYNVSFVNTVQVFLIGKQVALGGLGNMFHRLCSLSAHNRLPHCSSPSTCREEERKGSRHAHLLFRQERTHITKCVFMGGDSLF